MTMSTRVTLATAIKRRLQYHRDQATKLEGLLGLGDDDLAFLGNEMLNGAASHENGGSAPVSAPTTKPLLQKSKARPGSSEHLQELFDEQRIWHVVVPKECYLNRAMDLSGTFTQENSPKKAALKERIGNSLQWLKKDKKAGSTAAQIGMPSFWGPTEAFDGKGEVAEGWKKATVIGPPIE